MTIKDIELPIRAVKIQGPAVEAWSSRPEVAPDEELRRQRADGLRSDKDARIAALESELAEAESERNEAYEELSHLHPAFNELGLKYAALQSSLASLRAETLEALGPLELYFKTLQDNSRKQLSHDHIIAKTDVHNLAIIVFGDLRHAAALAAKIRRAP